MSLEECRIIEIPSFSDSRGDLCVLEKGDVLPFEIKRIFYTYNVPPSESRGAHAHKKCHQFLIAVSGAVRVTAEDGRSRKEFCLGRIASGRSLGHSIRAYSGSGTARAGVGTL